MVDKVIPAYPSQSSSRSNLFVGFIGVLLTIGFLARAIPLLNQGGRLLRQYPTEDGYLMLTIARNLALGHGMSVAEGTIPTNGTQPLFNLVEALAFLVMGGDKEAGVALVLVLQLFISVVSAGVLFLLAQQVLKDRSYSWETAALATGLWYASPSVVPHTMNCLETGAYIAMVLTTLYVWYRHESTSTGDRFSGWVLQVGVLLGITVWTRIDAVFLITAVTGWHALLGLVFRGKSFLVRVVESAVMGAIAVVVASPWLLYNKINFGSFTPISGIAQSYAAVFGNNASEVPATLFEFATFAFPIPHSLEKTWLIIAICLVFIVVYGVILGKATTRMTRQERMLLAVVATYGGLLVGYYGLLFGAPHFVSRYLSPISPFLAIFTAVLVIYGLTWLKQSSLAKKAVPVVGTLLLVVLTGMHGFLYKNGANHPHFQVAEWIKQNTDETTWVGAIQTGTLGFFHDRTINLDGKVNPQALEAKLQRKIPEYIVNQEFDSEGGKIEYLADWVGIAIWMDTQPLIAQHFEVVVEDPQINLAVLRRKA